VSRGFLLVFIALGGALAVLFAVFPLWDLEVAQFFFDPERARFPLSVTYEWNLVRPAANGCRSSCLRPPFAVLRKLIFPHQKMPIAPSVVLYLIGSFLIGPGVAANLVLKENWGRPRPNGVQQFAGTADFQPWWRPSDASKRNCCFVSGEASEAFWTVAPATLAPPRRRHLRHGGWLLARRVRTAFRQRYRLRRFDHYRRRVCPLPPPARSRQA